MDVSKTCRPFRFAISPIALFLVVSCGGGGDIVLVDTSIPPTLSEDDHLTVTLTDGTEVRLRIRRAAGEESAKTECDPSVYEDIGSLTFVERTLETETFSSSAEENARRAQLREQILTRRDELKEAFLDKFRSGPYSDPEFRTITCTLVLQPEDRIYMRLQFRGPSSSNVTIDCLGDGDARAQIRNPASTSMQEDKEKDPAMLDFRPTNCGIEPLEEGGSRFVDELGTVKSRCDPVRNVRIINCRIRGLTTARSMSAEFHKLSMIRADHVQRLQESAAQHVTFSRAQMEGRWKGVVHFLPGVHHFTIEDSEILGAFLGLTIHLPADGGWNVIKNNRITGQRKRGRFAWSYIGKKREVISIDSSEHNRIVNNHFSDMKYGGIKLYRNCGERGDIRHRIPQYNQIINNVFDYSVGDQSTSTVFLGSRDDKSIKFAIGGVKRYCHDDEGADGERFTGNDVPMPWDTETVRNSSESNSDWAQHNVIADNQLIQFKPYPLLKGITLSSKAKKLDNYIFANEAVADRSLEEALDIQRMRGAGCAVLAGVTNGMQAPYIGTVRNGNVPYIRNTSTIKYFWDIRPEVQLGCDAPLICQNNILAIDRSITCEEPIIHDFGSEEQACDAGNTVCVEGSNAGDSDTLGCPGGDLVGIQAACNLEFGKATDDQRRRVLLNRVKVVRASDDKDDGRCTADETSIKEGQRLVLPWLFTRYDAENAPNQVKYACREHDKNGGDCHVNIRHYCERLSHFAEADLIPEPRSDVEGPDAFCNRNDDGDLVVRVRNQTSNDVLVPTRTTVTFSPGGSSTQTTPPMPGGSFATHSFEMPGACFNPDCDFTIEVDSGDDLDESHGPGPDNHETNNVANGRCLG